MSSLKLYLLGPPRVERDGTPVEIRRRKAVALLAYLALTRSSHTRDALATLLWPEADQSGGRTTLRQALLDLNKALGRSRLDTTGETVALSLDAGLWIDVEAFRAQLATPRSHAHPADEICAACARSLTEAVELYCDDFMAGFTLPDSPAFDEWQFFQTEELRREVAGALEGLARFYIAKGKFELAIPYARRWSALDPLLEPPHRLLMQLYAWTDRRAAALRQYKRCSATLQEELGVTPEKETTALYRTIRQGQALTPPARPPTPPPASGPRRAPSVEVPPPTIRQVPATPQQRHRRHLLENVRTFWIQGVLENSLHGAMLLALGMKRETGVVDHPWDTLLRIPGLPDRTLPPDTRILNVFDRLNGKLLILGDPGSGKTTTLLELARDLLTRAKGDDGHPIPVILTLSSWSQRQKPLAEWLVHELGSKYRVPRRIAGEWVASDALLLLLDGLDEVAADRRNECVRAINAYRREHPLVDVVVCSRIADYQALTDKLQLNGAVVLLPLTENQVDAYLTGLGPDVAALRTLMAADAGLRRMSRSPLMLSVMVLAYHQMPPDQVLAFDTLEAQRAHLFDVYVGRMIERRVSEQPYAPERTVRYLSWLAERMVENGLTVFHVEDLEPGWLETLAQLARYREYVGFVVGLCDGLIFGAAVGLPAGPFGLTPALVVGLMGTLIWGLAAWLAARAGLWLSAGWNLILPVLMAAGLSNALLGAPTAGLVGGLLAGLLAGLRSAGEMELGTLPTAGVVQHQDAGELRPASGREARQPAPGEEPDTRSGSGRDIRRSVRHAVRMGVTSGLLVGSVAGLLVGPKVGLALGIVAGSIAASAPARSRAVIRHYVLRLVLSREQYIAWDYRRFLDYAVRLIFLRKVGRGYIFIHRYLLEHLAGPNPP